MTFTAYLLNLAAESLDDRAQKPAASNAGKGGGRNYKTFPQASQHTPRRNTALNYHSVYTGIGTDVPVLFLG